MNYLLDTHVFLWSLMSPKKLSRPTKEVLQDPKNTIWVSAVTYWEIALKFSLGKLGLEGVYPIDFPSLSKRMGFSDLNLDSDSAAGFYELSRLSHGDPFDRLIIWQAIRNKYKLISRDRAFLTYQQFGLDLYW